MYPGGTFEYGKADPEVLGKAATTRQGTNAEARRVFKPVPNDQGAEKFSPGGEEVYVPECQMGGSEQMPGGR
ncbi:hypothetical protein NDU88_006833 [Pleurodeles waltl]|uniref:Uncharacterized protein n=1 Tax=Pleurodeles waltl TaxID=8319 RepID=A0AAV7QIW6_PLEWA|nr:hypothetical protein NDU88_006833 [Pleurodeles waltl]